jgi:nucleotide-binding universal stress UspA family protein
MPILAAIDELERSEAIVSIAYDLAVKYDDTLIALHVVPEEDFESHKESLEDLPEFGDFSLDQEHESAAEFARRAVEQTIAEVDDDIFEPRGRVGDIADEILAETARVEPRFLVLSGRRRSPVGKAIFGSSTQKILLNADCPVITKMSA